MEKPSRGGEKRTAVWASHHEERGSDDVVAPPVCDHRVVPHRWVVFDRCNPSGSAADADHEAAAQVLGLRVRRMTVWWTFRRPFMGRPVPRQFMRNALLDLTTIVPATAYHRRSYAERYSRSMPALGSRKARTGHQATGHLHHLGGVLHGEHGKLPEGCQGEWEVGKGDPNETPMPQEVADRA